MAVSLSFDIFARDRASTAIRGVGEELDTNRGKWDSWKTGAAVAGAVVGAALFKFGKDSVAAYTESEQASVRFSDAFERFPALADVSQASLEAYNAELAKKTRFDDDATASGQATLAQFGLTGSQIRDLTPLLQDYAAKTGKDLPTAAQDLGKAMLGQGKALKAIGLDFTDAGSLGGNFEQVMAGLRTQVGGFAESEGTSAAGKSEILKNRFGELQEAAGAKLTPALITLADVGLRVVGWIEENQTTAIALVGVLGGFAAIVWGVNAATSAWAAIQAVSTGATAVATGAQWLWNAALTANPIGLVVVAIAALVAGIIWFATQTETGRRVTQAAMGGVRDAFGWVWDKASALFGWVRGNWPLLLGILTGPIGLAVLAITRNWDAIKGGVGDLLGWFAGVPGRMAGALSGMWDPLWAGFRAVANRIIRGWNNLELSIGGGSVFGVDVPRVTLATPNLPMLATGGTAITPGLAIVGEQGPEVLSMPVGASVIPLPRGTTAGGPALHIENWHAAPDQSPEELADALAWRARYGG